METRYLAPILASNVSPWDGVRWSVRGANRDRLVSFALACVLHLAVLFVGGAFLVREVQYGVQLGQGGIEVNLVAALPHVSSDAVQVAPEIPHPLDPPKEEAIVMEMGSSLSLTSPLPLENRGEVKERLDPISATQNDSEIKGDGSSAVPGTDPTTLYSPGGAYVDAKPGYLKNIPPAYPETARRQGQEGLVMLLVEVNRNGGVNEIKLKQSSGFPLLDGAALKAVRRWKFHPAQVGGLAVNSKVEVPIRFQLEGK